MTVFIGLIRGINVGGNKMLSMGMLKSVCVSLGFAGVRTYLQSGNVIFGSERKDVGRINEEIEERLRKDAGIDVKVILRTPRELRNVVVKNPFPMGPERNPAKLLVTFLSSELSREAKAALLKANTGSEEIHVAGRELYIYFPDGSGRSKLVSALTDKKLGVTATGRNWNTVTKLLEIGEGLEDEL